MVLAHSLKDNGTKAKLVALVTLDTVSGSTIDELKVRTSSLHVIDSCRTRLPI